MQKQKLFITAVTLGLLSLALSSTASAEWKYRYQAQGNNCGLIIGSYNYGGPLRDSYHQFPRGSGNFYSTGRWNWGVHVARDCDGNGTAEDTVCILSRGGNVIGGNNSLESIDEITALANAGERMSEAVSSLEHNRVWVSSDDDDLADWPPEFREGRSGSGAPILHGAETIATRYGDCFDCYGIGQSVEYQFYFLDFAESSDMVYLHIFFRNMSEYLKWHIDPSVREKVAGTPDGQVWAGMEQFYCTANGFRIGERDEAWAYYFPRQLIVMADRDGVENGFSGHPAAMAYYQMRNPHLRDEVLEFTNTCAQGWRTEFGFYPEEVMESGYPMNKCYRYGLGKNAPAGPFYPDDTNPYTDGGPLYGWPGVLEPGDARYEQWIWGEQNANNNYNFWSEFHGVEPRDSFSLDAAIMFVHLANEPYQFPSSQDLANLDDPTVQEALAPVLCMAEAADLYFHTCKLVIPERPPAPELTITLGDRQVTLTWSDVSLQAPDNYYYILQEHPELDPEGQYREHDFQGYKVYRSASSNPADALLLAQFDLDTGLSYSYVDDQVTNGLLYYYLVTAYDRNYLDNVETSKESRLAFKDGNRVVPRADYTVECELLGDVDFDGEVDIADVVAVVEFTLGGRIPSAREFACADLNKDETVNIFDVLACVNQALGQSLQLAGAVEQNISEINLDELKEKMSLLGAEPSLVEELAGFYLRTRAGAGLPKAFSLGQNSPNPFNPSTAIGYSVPEGETVQVSLRVFDVRGRLVCTLVDGIREPAAYRVFWDGRDEAGRQVSSGVYIYRMRAGSFVQARKMVLLK